MRLKPGELVWILAEDPLERGIPLEHTARVVVGAVEPKRPLSLLGWMSVGRRQVAVAIPPEPLQLINFARLDVGERVMTHDCMSECFHPDDAPPQVDVP